MNTHLTIDLNGDWRNYQPAPVSGWEIIGTVRSGSDMGALGKSPFGMFAMINNGTVTPIDKAKIDAELNKL